MLLKSIKVYSTSNVCRHARLQIDQHFCLRIFITYEFNVIKKSKVRNLSLDLSGCLSRTKVNSSENKMCTKRLAGLLNCKLSKYRYVFAVCLSY